MSGTSLAQCCHGKPRAFCDLCERDDEIARLRDELAEHESLHIRRLRAELAIKDVALTVKDAELADRDRVIEAARPAAQFIMWCLDTLFDGCDVDGGDAQDKLVELGLLDRTPTPEDSEWYGEYDFIYVPTAALKALDASPSDAPRRVSHTVEEYRERIREAHQAGWNRRDRCSSLREWEDWERSATKARLDEEVGNG